MVTKSLNTVRLNAYTRLILSDNNLMNAFLLFIASLSLFLAIPFYPPLIGFILAIIVAAIGYITKPSFGLIFNVILALFAFAYQSTTFAFVWLIVLSITLFTAFKFWKTITTLEILIFLPFVHSPLNILGGFVYGIMFLMSYKLGAKQSVILSIPSVLLILLLSSIWQIPNYAYFPLNLDLYETSPNLNLQDFPYLLNFDIAFNTAINNLTNFRNLLDFGDTLGLIFSNLLTILFRDTGLIQVIIWTVVLYTPTILSAKIKRGKKYLVFSLLIIPLAYTLIYTIFYGDVNSLPFIYVYSILSALFLYYLELMGFQLSNELKLEKLEEQKKLGMPGVSELTLGGSETSLNDVANYEDVKKEIKDSILIPLEHPEIAYAYKIKPPKGILLFGPPGTGKTMLMRAFAKEIDFNFFYVKSSELLSSLYGESERNISILFEKIRKNTPAIVFFDEIDAIAKDRTKYTTDEVTPRVLTALLQELDGFSDNDSIIFIAATNVPDQLDPALLRPGRIDKIIYMGVPDFEARKKIFAVHLRNVPHDKIDYDTLARMTENFTGADIYNAVKEAINETIKEAKKTGKIIPINMNVLVHVLHSLKPSVSTSLLEKYKRFKIQFERRTEKKQLKQKKLSFKDVADMEDVKKALKEAIELPMKYEEVLREFDITPPKGILLFGPPGTGKTYIVKACEGEFNINMFYVSGAEILQKGFEYGGNVIKDIFNKARDAAPAIIFLDEIDSIAPKRQGMNPILGELLQQLDGIKSLKNVIVIGATNLPELMDEALLRPGRFDKIIYVKPPNKSVREEMFNIHLGKFSSYFDVSKLSSLTEGFSAADISDICKEIKLGLMDVKIGKRAKFNQTDAEQVVLSRRPSITPHMLEKYESFLRKYGERK